MPTPYEKANEAHSKSKEKETKIQGTITKQTALLGKKRANFIKQTRMQIHIESWNTQEMLSALHDSMPYEHWLLLRDIELLEKAIVANHKKYKKQQEITEGHYEKLSSWRKTEAVFNELPPIVLQFAEDYKQRCIEWLLEGVRRYSAEYEALKAKDKANPSESRKSYRDELWALKHRYTVEVLLVYEEYKDDRRRAKAEEISEKNRVKLLKMFASRVHEKCGPLLAANGLTLGINGELNGWVEGKKARATIKTIAAGGYNIQCYHYRVLVQPDRAK